jgi:hypothetical protein
MNGTDDSRRASRSSMCSSGARVRSPLPNSETSAQASQSTGQPRQCRTGRQTAAHHRSQPTKPCAHVSVLPRQPAAPTPRAAARGRRRQSVLPTNTAASSPTRRTARTAAAGAVDPQQINQETITAVPWVTPPDRLDHRTGPPNRQASASVKARDCPTTSSSFRWCRACA